MPMPKQLGPAQPRRDAGVPEQQDNEESQHNKPERGSEPGRRIKGPPIDPGHKPAASGSHRRKDGERGKS